jgi:hypothetical protein
MSYPTYLNRVERAVRDEREAQDAKWGEQNHPDGTERRRLRVAGASRSRCQRLAREGRVTWRHILDEEVQEALAEEDPAKLRTELIQVAAVAQAWAEAIDRRNREEAQ